MSKKIKKILLINSPRLTLKDLNGHSERSKYFWEVYPPLGLMYLSANLKKDIKNLDIKIYDLHLEGIKKSQNKESVDWVKMTKKVVEEFKPDLVGLTVMFGAHFNAAKLVGESIKKDYPEIVIVSGGVHVTGLVKEKTNELDYNDFVSSRESEKGFTQLIQYLNNDTDKVNGITPIKTNLVRNKDDFLDQAIIVEHVDELPMPDFGMVDIHSYYKYGILSAAQTVDYDTPLATMLTVRGCTARCTFCSVRNFNGFGVRTHSPERVLKEISILYENYGIRHIDFVDDDFTVSKERVIKICEMLKQKKYNLTWSCGNGIRLGSCDDELLTHMADAGCTYVSFGIESGDGDMLKEMKKPLNLKILEKKAPLLDRHPRIYYRANFITGYPGERPDQLARTFQVAEKYSWDWSLFSLCKPLPDTELYNKILEGKFENKKIDKDKKDGDFSFENSQLTSNAEMEEEKKLFNTTYEKNLLINFKKNRNLKGRNIERSVRDFERVIKLSESHAFAWNCLVEGYEKIGKKEKINFAKRRTKELLKSNTYWKDMFDKLEFKPLY